MMNEKEQEWCNTCHVQHDCEDKEEFLESDEKSCFMYA